MIPAHHSVFNKTTEEDHVDDFEELGAELAASLKELRVAEWKLFKYATTGHAFC